MQGLVLLINIPPKVWRPKQINKFVPTDTYDDIQDGFLTTISMETQYVDLWRNGHIVRGMT